MTIHVTIWWLWWPLIAFYVGGTVAGLLLSMFGDDTPPWWQRPLILVWPATLTVMFARRLILFMIGKE